MTVSFSLIYMIILIFSFRPKRLQVADRSQEIPAIAEEQITTLIVDKFNYTETREGSTVFALSAEKVLGTEDEIYKLEDAELFFHTEDGLIRITCRHIDFDARKRDFGIDGNIFLSTEFGLNMWTEEMAYSHRSRFLMGLTEAKFTYGERFWGSITRPVMDVKRNRLTANDGLQIFDAEGGHFSAPAIESSPKDGILTFPEGVIFSFEKMFGSFSWMEWRERRNAISMKARCGELHLEKGADYLIEAPILNARFKSAKGLQPISASMPEGGTLVSERESITAGDIRLHFRDGEFKAFTVSDNFSLLSKERELHGAEGSGRMGSTGNLNEFKALGDILVCSGNTMIRSESLNAKIDNNEFIFKYNCLLRDGSVEATGDQMDYYRDRDEFKIEGSVTTREEIDDLHVTSDYAIIHPESRDSVFSGRVHAWTPQYDLQCGTLNLKPQWLLARENVNLVNYGGRKETLVSQRLEWNQDDNRIQASGSVRITESTYFIESDSLAGKENNGNWETVTFSGNVFLKDSRKGISGQAETLDLIKKLGETVFLEGCPAEIIDDEGKSVSAPVIIYDRTWGDIYLLGERIPSKLEVKGEQGTLPGN